MVPLQPGKYYHLYNRGIDGCDIFRENTNYEYFIKLYERHIDPIADTFAFVLMKNHFHFLVRIKNREDLSLPGLQDLEGLKKSIPPYRYFSNLFNAYSKAFNKKYNRTGSLFEKNLRRKLIDSQEYLKQVILYIHNNPVHHHFCELPEDYPWSTYKVCIAIQPTKMQREAVLGWFDNIGNFKYLHNQKIEVGKIESFLQI